MAEGSSSRGTAGRMSRALADVEAELAQRRQELRRAQKASQACARQWLLTDHMKRVTLIVFDQVCGDLEAPVKYMETVAKERRWPEKGADDVRRVVEDVFLDATTSEAPLTTYAPLVDLEDPADVEAARCALRYSEEWHVVQWAREQNAAKSLAPSTDQLLQHLEERRVRLPESVRPPPRGTSLDASARKWASRLRERWGGFLNKFKLRDDISLDERREKVYAVLQWWKHVRSRVPHATPVLRVNLDETSIALGQGGGVGSIFLSKRRFKELVEAVPSSKRRRCMTHIAFICDRTDLQPRLPQVIVANESTFLVRELAALQGACPPNVHLVRQKSAWNNEVLCAHVIGLLKKAVAGHSGGAQIILLLDCSRIHTTAAVISACRRHDVWPIFVPAKLTWLLQPLDTHAFGIFKHALRMAYQRARVESPAGDVSMARFLQCVCTAIRTVLQGRRWAMAFENNGFGESRLSPRIALALELADDPAVPNTRPTDAQLRACFPRNARIPAVWAPIDKAPLAPRMGIRARGRGRGAAVAAGLVAGRGRGDGLSRTRSGLVYKAE